MVAFRFRAAAALELRRRQEQDAATVLARAEGALRLAQACAETTLVDRRAAQEQQVLAECRGSDIATIAWHRNWIVRQTVALEACQRDVQAREAEVQIAERAWREARRKHLALERMRERSWRRHQDHERHEEMKVIDELARLRFVMNSALPED
jgi:flagellar export protein FliJ